MGLHSHVKLNSKILCDLFVPSLEIKASANFNFKITKILEERETFHSWLS